MDDGPRTGGLQALFLIVGVTAGFVAVSAGAVVPAIVAVASFAMLVWLERHARRRAREDKEIRERARISHLDF
jgi:Flp pilus assembly protein TadB